MFYSGEQSNNARIWIVWVGVFFCPRTTDSQGQGDKAKTQVAGRRGKKTRQPKSTKKENSRTRARRKVRATFGCGGLEMVQGDKINR